MARAGRLARRGANLYSVLSSPCGMTLHLPGIAARLGLLERIRLSPEGHSLDDMRRLTRAALARGQRFFMLTYHSSSLLPGATPYVRDAADRTCAGRIVSLLEGGYDLRALAASVEAHIRALGAD